MLTDPDSAPAGPGCIASCMQHTVAVHAAAVRRRLSCRLKVMEQWVSGSQLTGPSRWWDRESGVTWCSLDLHPLLQWQA